MTTLGKVRGFAAPTRSYYDVESGRDGTLLRWQGGIMMQNELSNNLLMHLVLMR